MVQVVLPNDANPMGFVLGGTVMHLADICGAIAAHRHARTPMVTAAVDGFQFLHPIRVGDLIILRATVTATFRTSLEVEVEVLSEGALSGERKLTSIAYLTFAAMAQNGERPEVPALLIETDAEKVRATAAEGRRAIRLAARKRLAG